MRRKKYFNYMKFILHVVANPQIPTDPQYSIDAFTCLIIKFCKLFHKKKHIIHFYGVEECKNFVNHTFYHNIINLGEYEIVNKLSDNFTNPEYTMYGSELQKKARSLVKKFESNLKLSLEKNYQKKDLVIHCFDNFINGYSKEMIHIKLSLMGGWWDNYKYISFATDSYMKHELNKKKNNNILIKKVIYPWFHLTDFDYNPNIKRKNTFLYLARCHKFKGILKFFELANQFKNYNFWIAGGCNSYDHLSMIMDIGLNIKINLNEYKNVKYWGVANEKLRKELLAKATALIQPTEYFEPCGMNVIESMISGTPVLVPNFGGFLDTVVDGITGFICKPNEWAKNLSKINSLNSYDCRKYSLEKFNESIAYKEYYNFFSEILEKELNEF